jgi:DNA helicase IV
VSHAADLVPATVEAVRAALEYEGSVGVIASPSLLAELPAFDERVTLCPPSLATGLEFDHVIVVEPADIVSLNRLYVVLTRAVSRLDVLHSRPLPALLSS